MADNEPKLTGLGKLVIFLFVAACIAGAYYLFAGKPKMPKLGSSSSGGGIFSSTPDAEIGIAYGTEKQRWLEWAVQEFAKTSQGKHIKINLIPMGSQEGAHAILGEDKRINAWSPASAAYKDAFLQDWQVKSSTNPIA